MNTNKLGIFYDTSVLLGRSMKHISRSVDTLITVCISPIAMMLLFVYVFGGALGNGMSSAAYVNYMVPGILLIAIASGIGYTALRLFADIKSGFFDRLHSMPIHASSALWAHVLVSLVSNALSILIIFFVAFLLGFRTSASLLNWLAIAGILALFTLALTWVAVIAALKAKSAEGSSAFSYPLAFLPFISSAFMPTETMSGVVRGFAEHQPVTAIVDSIRALLTNQAVNEEIWIALAWCIGIMLIAWTIAMRIYKQQHK